MIEQQYTLTERKNKQTVKYLDYNGLNKNKRKTKKELNEEQKHQLEEELFYLEKLQEKVFEEELAKFKPGIESNFLNRWV